AAGLPGTTLGFPGSCVEGCDAIDTSTIGGVAECLVCAQDLVRNNVLTDGLGTSPPDLPPNVISGDDAYDCQGRISRAMQKTTLKMYSTLAACELSSLETGDPASCETDNATTLADLRASLDATLDKCVSTTGLRGCRFENTP